MTTENTSKLGKLLLYSIIILILQVVAVILHGFVGSYTLPFLIARTVIITMVAMLLVTAIVGPRVIEKQKFVPLIIGITIAALSAIFIIYLIDPLIHNIDFIITYPHSSYLGVYIVLIILLSVSIALAVLILIRGIRLIIDYTRQPS